MEVNIICRKKIQVTPRDVIVNIMTREGLTESLSQSDWFDETTRNLLTHAQEFNDFKGDLGDILISYPQSHGRNTRVFVGLGDRSQLTSRQFQNAGAVLAKRVANLNLQSVILDLSRTRNADPYESVKPFLEGIAIGSYSFSKYVSRQHPFPLGQMTVVIPEQCDREAAETSVSEASYNVTASNFARHLTNEASNFKTPSRFENLVCEMLSGTDCTLKILHDDDLQREKLNLIRAVGQAGSELPRLIVIEHIHAVDAPTIGIVGKAVTFDSGGLLIKSHSSMPFMREDVGGAAVVAGVLSVINNLDLHYNVVAAIPVAENLIDSKSYRPSDVFITRNGLSVETNNTDAEGRLLLADSFLYLQDNYTLSAMIDVATLTGAIVRALGQKIAGYFTNNETLSDLLMRACAHSREKFWRMPLDEDYSHTLKSTYADLKNDGGEPKAITAALFLKQFVDPHLAWLHLDVGSLVMPDSEDPLYGGNMLSTGIPSMTLIELLRLMNTDLNRL